MSLYKLFSVDINLNFVKSSFICLIIFLLVGLGSSCSVLPYQMQETSSNDLFASSKINDIENISSKFINSNFTEKINLSDENQNFSIVGTWRSSLKKEGMNCKKEAVFQSNSTYSAVSDCNSGKYVARISGTWRIVKDGVIRLEYNDYSPKEINGKKIRLPKGETWSYRFINRNQIRFGNGITAYRAS